MTVTLTYDDTNARVSIGVSGILGASVCTIERTVDQVTWTTVRGAVSVPVTAGATPTLYDYEFTPGVANYYRAVSDVIQDNFGRTVASGSWGTADTGQVWTVADSRFSVSGGVGLATHASSGIVKNILAGSPELANIDLRILIAIGQKLTGSGSMYPGAVFHLVDAGNFYKAGLLYQASGTSTGSVGLVLGKVVGGDNTNLFANFSFDVYNGSEAFWLRVQTEGATIRIKAWRSSDTEPVDWATEETDGTFLRGQVGVETTKDAGITNVNPTAKFDGLSVIGGRVTAQQSNIIPTLTGVWLKVPARPYLNRQVTVLDWSDVGREARGGLLDIIGQAEPTAITDVRAAPKFDLDLNAADKATSDALTNVLVSGDVLLVQVPAASRIPSGYVYADDKESRGNRITQRRTRTLSCQVCAAPGAGMLFASPSDDVLVP